MNRHDIDSHQQRMATLALGASVLVLAASLVGAGDALAYLAPTAGLFALLVAGVYPGADAYALALARDEPKPAPRRLPSPPRPRRAVALPRGGALLAAGLAGRAPPLALR